MGGWRRAVWAACGVGLLLLGSPGSVRAAPPCDEYDPFGPQRSAQIRLGPDDFVDEDGTEMQSFIATDSVGRVDVAIVAGSPVLGISAVPAISMLSPYHAEQLKGIHVAVSLAGARRPVSVVLELSQVCAKYFRDTFLYY